jgi:hypothetical protein
MAPHESRQAPRPQHECLTPDEVERIRCNRDLLSLGSLGLRRNFSSPTTMGSRLQRFGDLALPGRSETVAHQTLPVRSSMPARTT